MPICREEGPTITATIDELLEAIPSKYALVHLAARRAREINNYYHSLGEGLGQFTPPLVDQVDSNKPLSIALEEIATGKIVVEDAAEARQAAADLLAASAQGEDEAEILAIDTGGEDERG